MGAQPVSPRMLLLTCPHGAAQRPATAPSNRSWACRRHMQRTLPALRQPAGVRPHGAEGRRIRRRVPSRARRPDLPEWLRVRPLPVAARAAVVPQEACVRPAVQLRRKVRGHAGSSLHETLCERNTRCLLWLFFTIACQLHTSLPSSAPPPLLHRCFTLLPAALPITLHCIKSHPAVCCPLTSSSARTPCAVQKAQLVLLLHGQQRRLGGRLPTRIYLRPGDPALPAHLQHSRDTPVHIPP